MTHIQNSFQFCETAWDSGTEKTICFCKLCCGPDWTKRKCDYLNKWPLTFTEFSSSFSRIFSTWLMCHKQEHCHWGSWGTHLMLQVDQLWVLHTQFHLLCCIDKPRSYSAPLPLWGCAAASYHFPPSCGPTYTALTRSDERVMKICFPPNILMQIYVRLDSHILHIVFSFFLLLNLGFLTIKTIVNSNYFDILLDSWGAYLSVSAGLSRKVQMSKFDSNCLYFL